MRLLDRYLSHSFLHIFGLALAAFGGIYLLAEIIEKIDDFFEHSAAFGDYLIYFSCRIPGIMIEIVPLAVLLATFLSLGSMARNNELTAIRASGIGLLRTSAPLLCGALIIAAVTLASDNWLVPLSTRVARHTLEVKVKGNPSWSLRGENIWLREEGRLIHIALALPSEERLEGVTLFNLNQNGMPTARLEADEVIFREGEWYTEKATRFRFKPGGSTELLENLEHQTLPMEYRPTQFSQRKPRRHELGIGDLHRLKRRLQRSGLDSRRVEVDFQARIAHGLTCLVMAFLGIPFALQRQRGGNIALGIGLSLGLGIGFFLLHATLLAFGYGNVLPPIIAAWATNLIFTMLGILLVISVKE